MRKMMYAALVAMAIGAGSASASSLGLASDFNVFVIQNVVELNSDSEGRMAVGGNATLTNFGVGAMLSNSAGTRDDLIVGGNLTYTNGQTFNGNVVYGGTASLSGLGIPNGTSRQESGVIDFAAAATQLENLSAQYATIPANANYVSNFGVTLTGTDPSLNVWNLTSAQLAAANGFGLTMNVPAGSTALINVSGSSINLANFQYFGFDPAYTLFNYYEASSVDIDMANLSPRGSILAPTAEVSFRNGQLLGTLVARSLDGSQGSGEFHHHPFEGTVPEPATAVLLTVGLALAGRRRIAR